MNAVLDKRPTRRLTDDAKTMQKLSLNQRRNKEQDHSRLMDEAADAFRYEDCRNEYWNPEAQSLFYGTPIWDQASAPQRVLLNQLYWVAYYAQIISAEIATILLNQTSGAGLYTMEGFRLVCDTLDLESAQERAHIAAFKKVSESVEAAVFGERLFTYPMRSMYQQTMVFPDTNAIKDFWRGIQLRAFTMLSSGNAFIGCQYFTVRGIRTLNGKMIQHPLSRFYQTHPQGEDAPIPSRISHYHFMDESYHFNSSGIISHDVLKSLPDPTRFESAIANKALAGCQKDHFHFSAAINGIFWHDPALYTTTLKMLTSDAFGLEKRQALEVMKRTFTQESDGLHASYKTHATAVESYKAYLADIEYVDAHNKEMREMGRSDIPGYLRRAESAYRRFAAQA